ncbi:hypothetical protein Y1Q_0021381 [Alligator mississippiensis]|uniref:Uncharacterized protein n=1 Tax=Alligator mississippiensis TaxID=8496 RepID=A0A151P9X3_ALLMI|nr:hypothetical protein Y1Q_0021381 [Alligator mississippiensis]
MGEVSPQFSLRGQRCFLKGKPQSLAGDVLAAGGQVGEQCLRYQRSPHPRCHVQIQHLKLPLILTQPVRSLAVQIWPGGPGAQKLYVAASNC